MKQVSNDRFLYIAIVNLWDLTSVICPYHFVLVNDDVLRNLANGSLRHSYCFCYNEGKWE